MEFKNWKGYTADEMCVLYTLVNFENRSAFTNRMVNEHKIRYVAKTKTYEVLDEELRAYMEGKEAEIFEEKMQLPRKLMALFPEGSKRYNAGTDSRPVWAYKSWRGNEVAVRRKLDAFFLFCGRVIDDDVLAEATRRYVNSFANDTTLMRVLPYFIIKNTSNGLESELLDWVESVESGEQETVNPMSDWTSNVI